jgi:hypothetical protein
MRCVLCGKEYKRRPSATHIESHGLSREEYDRKASTFSENAWEFYWSHSKLREQFPNPLATRAAKSKLTFRKWLALKKVQSKYPELGED